MDLAEVYMHTSSGKAYYPFAPKPEHVEIDVIAHHLATRGRWNGATQHRRFADRIFYSVAEHSVYVSYFLQHDLGRPDLALAGLLHDGAESYNGDLIRPLKYSPEFREPFKRVEEKNDWAVALHFGIYEQLHDPAVKIADDAVCHKEWLTIVPKDSKEVWTPGALLETSHTYPGDIEMLNPFAAKQMFLARFKEVSAWAA
jgi:hypothetical protein